MPNSLDDKLVIAISSRALFNLDDSHQVYEQEGLQAYSDYQIARKQVCVQSDNCLATAYMSAFFSKAAVKNTPLDSVYYVRFRPAAAIRIFLTTCISRRRTGPLWPPIAAIRGHLGGLILGCVLPASNSHRTHFLTKRYRC